MSTNPSLGAELIALAVAGDVPTVRDRTAGLTAAERKGLWKDAKRSTEALRLLCGVRIVVETHHGDGRVTESGPGAGVTNRKVKWLRKQFAGDAASLPALAKVASINHEREAPSIYRAAMALGGALASQAEVRRLLAAESPFSYWDELPEVRDDLVRAVANRPEGWRIAELDRFFAVGWHDQGIVGELHDGHPAFAEHTARWWGLSVAYKWGERDDIDPLNDASLLYALTVPRKESWQPLSDTFVTRPGVHAACRERCADPGFRRELVALALEQLGAPHKPLIAKSWLTLLQGAEASTAEQGADPDGWAALATAKEASVALFGIATLVELVEAGHSAPSAGLARLGEAIWHSTGKVAVAAWKAAAKLAGRDADLAAQLVGIAGEAQGSRHRKLAEAAKKLLDAHGVDAEAEDEGPAAASVDLKALSPARATDSPWLASLRASLGAPWTVRAAVQEPPFLGEPWQPLASADAVAEEMAGALQGDGLDPRWDQILDGVVRHPEPDATVRKTLSPIFAATLKYRREYQRPAIGGHIGALERLAAAWLGDELPPISAQAIAEPNHRVEGALAALAAGDPRTPLSTPTTTDGWLDPVVFAQRIAVMEPRHPVELSLALRRLPAWPSRRAEALALLPAEGGLALAAAYEALAVGADPVPVADGWLVATIPERKMWFMGWWSRARGTWERESARSTALSWDLGNPTDQAAAGRRVHAYAPAMADELAAVGAKRLSDAVVHAEHIGKNTGAMALILLGLHPTVDVAALFADLAAGFPSKFPAHRVAILDLLEAGIRDGRLAPRTVAEAFAAPVRTAPKNLKGVHAALSDWAATGDLATAVVLMIYEAAVAAGDMDGLGRNASPLLNGLDALLMASGRALDGAEARAVIAELAGRKKANAAVKAARAIHARTATQPSLDLLAASELLA